jgi:hypothetical protein
MSAEPKSPDQKDTTPNRGSSATNVTSVTSLGTMTERMGMDKPASEYEAQCLAYRHAIKDVARETDPVKLKEALSRLLSDDAIGTLGRDLHFVVKHAVRMVFFAEKGSEEQCREATTELFKKVKELSEHATVRGWRAD